MKQRAGFTPLNRASRLSARNLTGFTLVEVIVVAGIIAIAFISILSLIRQAIVINYSNQKYLEASMIAQDGLELARYVRDQNWLIKASTVADSPFYLNLAKRQSQTNGVADRTIFAIDSQVINDDPNTPNLDGRARIIPVYNNTEALTVIKDSAGQEITNCNFNDSANNGVLTDYLKSPCALIYKDTTNHNAYTTQVIDNITADSRYQPTIFSRLLEATYFTNGTSNTDDDYIYVKSSVYWKDRGTERYLTLGTYLYDYSWKF